MKSKILEEYNFKILGWRIFPLPISPKIGVQSSACWGGVVGGVKLCMDYLDVPAALVENLSRKQL